jgi:hypothetical protein
VHEQSHDDHHNNGGGGGGGSIYANEARGLVEFLIQTMETLQVKNKMK